MGLYVGLVNNSEVMYAPIYLGTTELIDVTETSTLSSAEIKSSPVTTVASNEADFTITPPKPSKCSCTDCDCDDILTCLEMFLRGLDPKPGVNCIHTAITQGDQYLINNMAVQIYNNH